MNRNLSIILYELIGGGYSDWEKLDKYINEYDLEPRDIIKQAEEISEPVDFNALMYATLYLGFEKMKEKVLNTIKENGWEIRKEIINWIEDSDFECYINYLDSSIQTPIFREYTMEDLKYENMIAKFIADVWREIR